MKKYIWLFCFVITFASVGFVQAQSLSKPLTYKRSAVFSPALFDSKLWNAKTTTTTGTTSVVQRPTYRRSMTLRYEPGITELTEEQKNMLLPIVNRIKKRTTQNVQLIAASRDIGDSPRRMQNVADFLNAHNDSGYTFRIYLKLIPIDAVIDSNNNTVKIIESN